MAERGTHILRVALEDEPAACRDIEIGSEESLYDLAKAIVRASGCNVDHAFGFYTA